jgi:hypothetical protein
MGTPNLTTAANRHKLNSNAGRNNQPDPRPLTEYAAEYTEPGGTHSRITITLAQPCVIRGPKWRFIDIGNGDTIAADSLTVVSNTTFYFDFADIIDTNICFVDVPYQDMQVQNFQGGFVRPGGQWFRKPS